MTKHTAYYPRSGFTLIEISIVLVIIGLIVGGVLVGRDLINAAAVRAQISQIEKYQSAVNTFRGKYSYLPGDIKDPVATQFGFKARGLYAGEGDGNGLLEGIITDAANQNNGTSAFAGEDAMFWVDLSTARLIDGGFTLATSNTIISSVITGTAINRYFPKAKIGGSSYVYAYSGGWQNLWNGANNDGVNYFAITTVTGGVPGTANRPLSVPSMTVNQAYNIDKKVDDGMPQSGSVLAIDAMTWASGGGLGNMSGVPFNGFTGDNDPGNGGPVVAGDGEATAGPNQGTTITCYDNNNIAGATETYSMLNGTLSNCMLSFKFQ